MFYNRITALLLCGILLLGLTACNSKNSSQNGSESNVTTTAPLSDLNAMPENSYKEPTILLDQITVAAGSTHVPFRVIVYNNPGYSMAGLRLIYDDDLKPYFNPADHTVEYEPGQAANGLMHNSSVSEEKFMIGFAGIGVSDITTDGIIFTCYFDVPSKAASGDVYPIKIEIVDFKNLADSQLNPSLVQGSITIQ